MIKVRSFWWLLVLLMVIGNADAQLATDCTLYVSPSGRGNGGSPSAATTLTGAQKASAPGDVICMIGGAYSLSSTSHSHSASCTSPRPTQTRRSARPSVGDMGLAHSIGLARSCASELTVKPS